MKRAGALGAAWILPAAECVQATHVRTLVMLEMHRIMNNIDVGVSPTNRRTSFGTATTRVIHA